MNLKSFLFVFSLLLSSISFGQTVQISGTVLENPSCQPIAFATVVLMDDATNEIITGTTTDENGKFQIDSKTQNIKVEISLMGYTTKTLDKFTIVDNQIKLGNIYLSEDAQALDEIVLTADVPESEFKLDKRIFNISQDLSSSGLGALDVLSNVPSVNVSIEGTISLRGSTGVQILINGKPSVLASEEGNALGTITSDMIERIEVITNPSAKYDAEGTSGIINIVLKKEEREGLNGSVSVNTGTPNNHSLGFSVNRRTEKFNLFSQIGAGKRTLPRDAETENIDLTNNSKVASTSYSERNEAFINVTLGTDYLINENNVITLSGNYAFEKEDNPSETHFSLYENDVLTDTYSRRETASADNPKYQYELQYKRDFERHEDQDLLFSALGSFFGKEQESEFTNSYANSNEVERQQTKTDFGEAEYTFKLDYTHPFNDTHTIETGAQYVLNDVHNDYTTSNFEDGEFVANPNLSNIFNFNQNVLGLYGTYGYERERWGVKLGVRLENTDVKTLLENTNESNDRNYTNFFPSAHTSFKVTDNYSLQAGYSKRIYRPRLWDLNPFVNIQNTYNLRSGNPNLQPEYTNSYELTNIYKLGKLSLNAGIFYRYTTDVIERIVSYEGNISLTRPENIGTNQTTGLELNAKINPIKWLSLTADFNYENFNRDGEYNDTSFDFSGNKWTGKLTSKFKLPAVFDFEFSANYNSDFQTLQQEISDTWFVDLGLRKKILKGKAIANLSVRDLFATRIFESYTYQDDFYQMDWNKRGRFVTFGLSFGFGKGEAMEFSGAKRH